jgi:hypothetical protein
VPVALPLGKKVGGYPLGFARRLRLDDRGNFF